MSEVRNLPPQLLPFSLKNKVWRTRVVDWADSKTFFNYSLVRKSVIHKKINYDLLNGRIHMSDLELVLNPDNIKAGYVTEKIPHYPIMNSKLNVLRGEESKRLFDFKVVVTNPNAISEIEENKKNELFQRLQQVISNSALSEDEFNAELEKINYYYTYQWLDLREIRGNALLNHYVKELNIPLIFNQGFMDAMAVAEEMYMCDIVGGEPTLEKLNPLKTRIFKSGYSNRVEDADIIVLEDFWSPGRVIDTYYDVLTKSDMDYIEKEITFVASGVLNNNTDNYDERTNFILNDPIDAPYGNLAYFDPLTLFDSNYSYTSSNQYYDGAGNIRVLRIFWKSRRKIKKIKSYDPLNGEEVYNFYPETYVLNKTLGEEELIFWINEAWEGTKIGRDVYVNMRPRLVQYNRISNPSRCHFGIIGSIYNMNDLKPYSLVDMMKPYNYLYDAIHDRLNKAIAANWGKIMGLDLAMVPKGWDVEKWMYYAKVNHIAVTDSFKEGNIGAATGKLAGGFANGTGSRVIDAETGNYILQHINLLEFIKLEMAEVAGISKQREGLISNRETVGGVERANLLSSHITEWLFQIHDDVKKRVLECFLETAKIALRGRNKKFQYILSDMSTKLMDVDGDEFAECDYGLVVDNSNTTQDLNSKLDTLALAALLNLTLSFSTIMKLYGSNSIAEKLRMVEKDEQDMLKRQADSAQLESQLAQQTTEANLLMKKDELELRESLNIRDNQTKVLIALMAQFANEETSEDVEYSPEAKADLLEKMRQFDESLKLDRDKLNFEKTKHQDDVKLKTKALNKPKTK